MSKSRNIGLVMPEPEPKPPVTITVTEENGCVVRTLHIQPIEATSNEEENK